MAISAVCPEAGDPTQTLLLKCSTPSQGGHIVIMTPLLVPFRQKNRICYFYVVLLHSAGGSIHVAMLYVSGKPSCAQFILQSRWTFPHIVISHFPIRLEFLFTCKVPHKTFACIRTLPGDILFELASFQVDMGDDSPAFEPSSCTMANHFCI